MQAPLLFDKDDHNTVTLTLNRPEVRNALNSDLMAHMQSAFDTINNDDTIRAVIIKANGPHFCAGADLNYMQSMRDASESENKQDALKLASLFETLNNLSKPTIALVQGAAMGGALGIIACCDIAIASLDAKFCFSEAKLGLIPATIAPYIIDAIGQRNTRELFITAELFAAERAMNIGLIHQVCDSDNLEHAGNRYLRLVQQNGPKAIADIKLLLQQLKQCQNLEQEKALTANMIAASRVSDEGQEGLSAFFEKRKANWQV